MRALAVSFGRPFPTERKIILDACESLQCISLVVLRWVQSASAAVTSSEAWMGLSSGMETWWYAGPDPEVPWVPYWNMLLFFFFKLMGSQWNSVSRRIN